MSANPYINPADITLNHSAMGSGNKINPSYLQSK